MLSYQHEYHAGNFADVIKHLVLVHLLQHLTQKDKPFLYLDTHAGSGRYDLRQGQAQRTREFESGIGLLWKQRSTLARGFQPYLEIITALNGGAETLQHYPGSPAFAIQSLRSIDRLYFCEVHPQAYTALNQLPKQNKRIHVSRDNGWDALKALLPPPERRGLIFIDPSFEIKTDYQTIPKQLQAAYQKFPQGVYCLWYPLLPSLAFKNLTHKLRALAFENTLNIEFFLTRNPTDTGLYGSGLFVINPPYTLEKTVRPLLASLKTIFHPGESGFFIG